MGATGIIWAMIFCVPFWLIVILLVNPGVVAIGTVIFVGLILSVILLIFIFPSSRKTNYDEKNDQLFIPVKRFQSFHNMDMELKMIDNGGNRTGIDRRIFDYSVCIPERRSGRDRRRGFDRRNSIVQRNESERRQVFKTQSLNWH